MVKGAKLKDSIPECIKKERNESSLDHTNSTEEDDVLPDYGPRYAWDQHTQGMVLGSYFYGYVISNLIAGWMADWCGPWHIIFWVHLVGAFINSAIPFLVIWSSDSVGYILAIICRVILGFGAGLIYPAIHCLIAHWAPPVEKGKFVAALMGNNLGIITTWPLVGAITQAANWQWGFHFITFQSLIFVVIFAIVASDDPGAHRFISAEERDYIKEAIGTSISAKKVIPPFLAMFKSFPFWILTILHFGNEWGLYLQLTGVPKFIAEVIGIDLAKSGGLSSVGPAMRMIAGLMFGTITDLLAVRGFSNTCLRKFFVLFSHVLSGFFLLMIAIFIGCDVVPIVVLLGFSMGCNGAATVTNLRNPQDLAPNFAGTIYGIITFIGGMAGFIVPSVTGALIQYNNGAKEWAWCFGIGAAMYMSTGIVFMIFGTAKLQPWNEKAEDKEPE